MYYAPNSVAYQLNSNIEGSSYYMSVSSVISSNFNDSSSNKLKSETNLTECENEICNSPVEENSSILKLSYYLV